MSCQPGRHGVYGTAAETQATFRVPPRLDQEEADSLDAELKSRSRLLHSCHRPLEVPWRRLPFIDGLAHNRLPIHPVDAYCLVACVIFGSTFISVQACGK